MNLSELKDPSTVEVEILMSRENFAGSFLVVEGEDDSRFWRTRADGTACEIVIGGGKPAVVEGIRRLDRRAFRGALGVVDADFDRADARPLDSHNLVTTHDHDLETVLLRTSALDRILVEHGEPAKIARFEAEAGMSVRDALFARALPFGRLRWLSRREELALPLADLSHRRFVGEHPWHVDESALLQFAAENCRRAAETLRAQLHALPCCEPWSLCQGHDLVKILVIGLRKALGSLKPQVGHDTIAALLRAGAQEHELAHTHLWRGVRTWERANAPFRVLPPAL